MIYIGSFRIPPGDSANTRIRLSAREIIAVVPWQDVPQSLRDLALDRACPVTRRPRTLIIATRGRLYPASRRFKKYDLYRIDRGNRPGRRTKPITSDSHYLRQAGFLPIAKLARSTGYNSDHLRFLARSGRCGAQKSTDGRWWMHEASIYIYMSKKPRHGQRGPRKDQ